MNFTSPTKIDAVVQAMKDSDRVRSLNRARINNLFNGGPPYTKQEETENRINTNVNFLEAAKIAHDARSQLNNAFLKPSNYFTVRGDFAPPEKKISWSNIVTKELNRILKRSLPYTVFLQNIFAQVALHGAGPAIWPAKSKWMPEFVGMDDCLFPSNTRTSLDNLDHFAILRRYTAGELIKRTRGPAVDKGWNMTLVNQIIAKLAKLEGQYDPNTQNYNFPEKVEEDFKSNSGFYSSDASPTISVIDFFFSNDDGKWERRIITDCAENPSVNAGKDEFLFNPSGRNYADTLDRLLHVQIADGAHVAPFRYHSIRSLGFLLYPLCHLQNRLRGKLFDAAFESCLWYFRNVGTGDQDRLDRVDLHHLGFIPEGLQFVPENERPRVNYELVSGAMSMTRQLMSENSASFTQDVDNGTRKELTATEVMARVNSATSMVNAMLMLAYIYQTSQYYEICRRFCEADNDNGDIQKFRQAIVQQGVDPRFCDIDSWVIEPERVIGAGNKTLEIAQATKLMEARPAYDPNAQRQILHIYTEAMTDDAQLAEMLVPLDQGPPSPTVEKATLAWGSLMMGAPVVIASPINEQEYIQTLLMILGNKVQTIEQNGGMVDPQTLAGLMNVGQHIQQHIQNLASDPNQKELVKQYMDALNQIGNLVKAFAQRLEEQMQAQGQQMDPQTKAKVDSMYITAKAKADIATRSAELKLHHKDVAFVRDQVRRDAQTKADIGEQDLKAQADIIRDNATALQQPKESPSEE